ncbi:MAG: hypothetical protein OEZ19_10290 [Paracoccaceae bacterium]|nr:hypothetical protein [Paracoccaceae bacterium]
MRKYFLFLIVSGFLTACADGAVPPLFQEEQEVAIYRGLRIKDGNGIDWSKTSFGVSGKPPTLSFFDTREAEFFHVGQ